MGPNYQFIYTVVGSNGSLSSGGVFRNCSLFEALENGLLPNNGVIVGDDAFPLKTYLTKPYPGANLAYDKKNIQLQTQELGEYPKMDLEFWLVNSEYSRNL